MNKINELNRFYAALLKLEHGLGGKRYLSECSAKLNWPKRGVYFFFEDGELRHSGEAQRVVRVGTHQVTKGSKATLWNRLRTHRGSRNGQGNHRGSIFRHHVGEAIAEKNSWNIPSWRYPQKMEDEKILECAVSAHIGRMSVLCITVDDEASPTSDRAYIERNSIGLLTCKSPPLDAASSTWLGLQSPNMRIRQTGIWNLDFCDYPHDQYFLDVFEEYVAISIEEKNTPATSIAPCGSGLPHFNCW